MLPTIGHAKGPGGSGGDLEKRFQIRKKMRGKSIGKNIIRVGGFRPGSLVS